MALSVVDLRLCLATMICVLVLIGCPRRVSLRVGVLRRRRQQRRLARSVERSSTRPSTVCSSPCWPPPNPSTSTSTTLVGGQVRARAHGRASLVGPLIFHRDFELVHSSRLWSEDAGSQRAALQERCRCCRICAHRSSDRTSDNERITAGTDTKQRCA